MLLNVHIKNLALIEDADITFTDGLNILTGETGAGKSIIIGALKIGMGGRLPKDMLRDPLKEGLCQLLFIVNDERIKGALKELEVYPSEDGELIISRKIMGNRTVNTINDVAVTAAKLRDVTALLVDMHAQHEQQTLLKKTEHLNILDAYGKKVLDPLKENVKKAYHAYKDIEEKLASATMDDSDRNRRLEFLKYEVNEIEAAALRPEEDEEVERQYNRMTNARDIVSAAGSVYAETGYEATDSVGNKISRALNSLRAVKELDPELENIYGQLVTVDSLLNDFNVDISDYIQGMEFDNETFEEVVKRLDVINNMKGKYGDTISVILEEAEKKKREIEQLEQYDRYIAELESSLSSAEETLKASAEELSKARKAEAVKLCDSIRGALADLSFMEVKFDMVFDRLSFPSANGIDDCYFVISTNVGEKLRPLYEVASGGELSRIMLAVKSCMASEDNIDTLIFDEIDVGISGMAAQKVAEKMNVIAAAHQVISITHLPQIAAMADSHYCIKKMAENGKTVTKIERLSAEESVNEIARLLGGASITDAVISNAREMKSMASNIKK